jgi:hypothetical protein
MYISYKTDLIKVSMLFTILTLESKDFFPDVLKSKSFTEVTGMIGATTQNDNPKRQPSYLINYRIDLSRIRFSDRETMLPRG